MRAYCFSRGDGPADPRKREAARPIARTACGSGSGPRANGLVIGRADMARAPPGVAPAASRAWARASAAPVIASAASAADTAR